ncbi:MAG: hypothetical protein KZQ56_06665 [gamma proteobacterium symbiont of Lucinoma myriamae]|nr:hypothetical protein [gamma proteobacterium symbiont of Lucinoma myriamae]MCU7832273.1 hypothetical protein [gamma proteobacterium symbiont of Lucinoma myriamae]
MDTIYIAVILLQGTYTPLVYAHDGRTQKKPHIEWGKEKGLSEVSAKR